MSNIVHEQPIPIIKLDSAYQRYVRGYALRIRTQPFLSLCLASIINISVNNYNLIASSDFYRVMFVLPGSIRSHTLAVVRYEPRERT